MSKWATPFFLGALTLAGGCAAQFDDDLAEVRRTQLAVMDDAVTQAKALAHSIASGDVQAVASDWQAAHEAYQRVELVAMLFPEVDQAIDALGTTDEPVGEGFHALAPVIATADASLLRASRPLADDLVLQLESAQAQLLASGLYGDAVFGALLSGSAQVAAEQAPCPSAVALCGSLARVDGLRDLFDPWQAAVVAQDAVLNQAILDSLDGIEAALTAGDIDGAAISGAALGESVKTAADLLGFTPKEP